MDESLSISVFRPLAQAWERMKAILFDPFDLQKWLVLGFSCFLAELASYASNLGGNSSGDFSSNSGGNNNLGALGDFWTQWGPAISVVVIVIAIAALLLLIAIGVVLLWVSCRGHFVFVDNVVHNRAQIVAPWQKFKEQGWTLFYIYLIAGGLFFLSIIVY
ncbi:MAG: hypothetical protein AAF558_15975, partial [Verrucomicrobiota bacterium]